MRRQGRSRGVPFLVKDNLETKGLRTTFGSRLLEDNVPTEDAVVVERLRAAGAVLLGKTNTPEFAHDVNTSNFLFGTTRNPWNLMVTAGGSSGGSGAAVAAAFAPLALGTDLGGSVRIPASSTAWSASDLRRVAFPSIRLTTPGTLWCHTLSAR